MNGANGEWDQCAVCGRTILRGERAYDYIDAEGEKAEVCPLCKPRAEASGWLPEAYAQLRPQPQARRRGATALRERIARTVATVTDTASIAEGPREPTPPPAPPTPLEVFNASSEVRKVSGLMRSLGEPRVCVRRGRRGEGTLIVVAWDLSWYRWSVQQNSVKQLAKGNEISELPAEDRGWNATAAEDGTLSRDS
jgi:hypothetical protein